MNIALIGFGRMGHEIKEIAHRRGHQVGPIIDIDNKNDFRIETFSMVDVVIEFTTPETAFDNIVKCLEMKKPIVSGTTGWLTKYDEAVRICNENRTAFIHSSNYSVGVNMLFRLNTRLASMMSSMSDYSASIEEIHHTKKLDAPSGTAISLAQGIIGSHKKYKGWKKPGEVSDSSLEIKSVREGTVPGTHIIEWDSEIDRIIIKHEAKGRKGFALGAVLAAEYIAKKKGVFTMEEVLGF